MAEAESQAEIRIRPALPEEAQLLSELALRAKGHWGYDQDFLEACRSELTLTPDYIAASPVFVLEEGAHVIGFYGLREQGNELELLYLFVEPSAFNRPMLFRGCGFPPLLNEVNAPPMIALSSDSSARPNTVPFAPGLNVASSDPSMRKRARRFRVVAA